MVKAAIEMSLGFIIAVVFAIVMLGLAITWIQGMFIDIGRITADLTTQAKADIRDRFAGGDVFGISPDDYSVKRGEGFRMQAGIKNSAEDSRTHYFKIAVLPAGVSDSICAGGELTCPSPRAGQNIGQYMATWVTYDSTITPYEIGAEAFKFIDVAVPPTAKPGTYIFNVVACFDGQITTGTPSATAVPATCNLATPADKIWGNPQQFIVTVS